MLHGLAVGMALWVGSEGQWVAGWCMHGLGLRCFGSEDRLCSLPRAWCSWLLELC